MHAAYKQKIKRQEMRGTFQGTYCTDEWNRSKRSFKWQLRCLFQSPRLSSRNNSSTERLSDGGRTLPDQILYTGAAIFEVPPFTLLLQLCCVQVHSLECLIFLLKNLKYLINARFSPLTETLMLLSVNSFLHASGCFLVGSRHIK